MGEKETGSTLLAGGQLLDSSHQGHATMFELEQVLRQSRGGVLVLDSYLVDAKVLEAVNHHVRNWMLPQQRQGEVATTWSGRDQQSFDVVRQEIGYDVRLMPGAVTGVDGHEVEARPRSFPVDSDDKLRPVGV